MVFNKRTGEAIAYTQEEREDALCVSLTALASSMGYTPVRAGQNYILKEMDSLTIYHDRSWNRFSGKGNRTGGSQIDFLLEFGGVPTVAEAIRQLLEFRHNVSYSMEHDAPVRSGHSNADSVGSAGYSVGYPDRSLSENADSDSPRKLVLPPKNKDYRRVYAYLIKTRGLSQEVVHDFIHKGLIYEDAVHHNVVFCGRDPEGNIRYAGLRGTADLYGKKFKMDVAGNDKHYGVNIVNRDSDQLCVFESVIDCMSYIDLFGDNWSNKLVLGMVEDTPLQQFVKDYSHIRYINFCLDNDEAGQSAEHGHYDADGNLVRKGLLQKYEEMGYVTASLVPPYGKDWNELLLYKRDVEVAKESDVQANRHHRH